MAKNEQRSHGINGSHFGIQKLLVHKLTSAPNQHMVHMSSANCLTSIFHQIRKYIQYIRNDSRKSNKKYILTT